jgi:hypothetical protein
MEGSEKQGSVSNIGWEAKSKLSPQLTAVTLRITDSCELTCGTGILRRVALSPAENELSTALTQTLCLITSSELIPSGEDALDVRVELAGIASDFARVELVHSFITLSDLYLLLLILSLLGL